MDTVSKNQKNIFLEHIFLICYFFIDISNVNIIMFFIISCIESIQILHFSINDIFKSYWMNDLLFDGFTTLIRYFWVDKLFIYNNNFNGFLMIYIIMIIVIVWIFSAIIYIGIYLKKNYQIPWIPKLFIKSINFVYVPTWFVPMFSTLISIWICYDKSVDGETIRVINSFRDERCWNGYKIWLAIISIISIVFLFIYGYILTSLTYETNPKSTNIKSRFSSNYEIWFFLCKIIWVWISEFSNYFFNERLWIMAVVNPWFSCIAFFYLIQDLPYYNTKVNKILLIFRTIELLTAVIILISTIFGEGNFEGAWTMFFFGNILIVIIYILYPVNKWKTILLNIESIHHVNWFQKKLVYTIEWIENQDRMEFDMFLKGYIITNASSNLKINCNDSTCGSANIKDINNNLENNYDNYWLDLKNKIESVPKNLTEKAKKHVDEYFAFQKFINECYKKGWKKFPLSNSLRLNYLWFSIEYLQNPQLSMIIIKQIDMSTLTMEDKFILFRYSKSLEEKLCVRCNPSYLALN